jgi:plasmid stability protein
MRYAAFMRYLTIRNVPVDLARRLDDEKRARGRSLNETVLDLLSQAVGLGEPSRRRNGLAQLAGSWSPEEQHAFEQAIAGTEQIDEELWR